MSVARPKERADQVSTLTIEDQEWVVHLLSVIAMVEGAFLLSVYRIVGCIEVQKHLLGSTVLAPLFEIELEDDLGYLMAGASCGRVLEAREGRLARQILCALGQRATGEF